MVDCLNNLVIDIVILFIFFYLDIIIEEEMLDFVFVLSVIVLNLDDIFMIMKLVIIEIFNIYGLLLVCYVIIIFGKYLNVIFDIGEESDFSKLRKIL